MKLWRKFLGEEIQPLPEKKQKPYSGVGSAALYLPWFNVESPSIRIESPASPATWKGIRVRADSNATAYERVFTNVPRDSFRRYDAVFGGFPSAGLSDDGRIRRILYAQPPDLQEQFMAEPSIVNDYVTSAVGRHNVEKAMKALKAGESRVKGFWVAMPLLWGNGMDDPAATMPNEIIAALPRETGLRGGEMLASQSVDEGHGEQA
ncbi:hypothetical protein C9416_20395 [Stenotrophomonas sp. Nf4]|nr:hypothetical protein C9416_20395 [Stenotrophomonas sp. Nf4]